MKKISVLLFFLLSLGSHPVWAERALETEGVEVLGHGRMVLELGVEHVENRQLAFDTSRVGRRQTALPAIGLAFGIGEQVEIQGDFDVFWMDEDGRDDTYDVGDLELWTKIKLLDMDEKYPGVGLRFGVKLPNASNESRLGTDETDFLGHFIFSDKLGEIEARANIGIGILGNPNENNSQDDVVIYGVALLYPATGSITLFTEVFGQGASNEDNNYSTARAGLMYQMNDDLMLDLSGRAGVTDESEDWGVGAGLTWQFTGLKL